jgi:Transposase IS116/IS110/IS902 family
MEIRLLSITALISSPSEPGRSIGCGGICSSCARRSSARSSAARSTRRARDRVDRRLRKLPADARIRVARDQIARLRSLNRQIDRLKTELGELVAAHRPKLLAEQGCGALTAAIPIGHTAGNERFRSEASVGLQTGTAPIPCSSGQRTQPRLTRGGDRQLNLTRCTSLPSPGPTRPGDHGVPVAQGGRGQDQQEHAAHAGDDSSGNRGRPEVNMLEPVTTE